MVAYALARTVARLTPRAGKWYTLWQMVGVNIETGRTLRGVRAAGSTERARRRALARPRGSNTPPPSQNVRLCRASTRRLRAFCGRVAWALARDHETTSSHHRLTAIGCGDPPPRLKPVGLARHRLATTNPHRVGVRTRRHESRALRGHENATSFASRARKGFALTLEAKFPLFSKRLAALSAPSGGVLSCRVQG